MDEKGLFQPSSCTASKEPLHHFSLYDQQPPPHQFHPQPRHLYTVQGLRPVAFLTIAAATLQAMWSCRWTERQSLKFDYSDTAAVVKAIESKHGNDGAHFIAMHAAPPLNQIFMLCVHRQKAAVTNLQIGSGFLAIYTMNI